jgi:hypothetical protein
VESFFEDTLKAVDDLENQFKAMRRRAPRKSPFQPASSPIQREIISLEISAEIRPAIAKASSNKGL